MEGFFATLLKRVEKGGRVGYEFKETGNESQGLRSGVAFEVNGGSGNYVGSVVTMHPSHAGDRVTYHFDKKLTNEDSSKRHVWQPGL